MFSFDVEEIKKEFPQENLVRQLRDCLTALHEHGFIRPANLFSKQLQFKNREANSCIEESKEPVYVKNEKKLDKDASVQLRCQSPTGPLGDCIIKVINDKPLCFYCSAGVLNPLEATIHSAISSTRKNPFTTTRYYQFGFTFAPFGDPRKVCHLLKSFAALSG